MTRPLILTLTAALLSACAPTVTRPKEIVIDGFKIEPGQHWIIEARGGKGWNDRVDFVVGSRVTPSNTSIDIDDWRFGGGIQYFFANPERKEPFDSLRFSWRSNSDNPELKWEWSTCILRAPKLSGINPPRIEGRWVLSLTRETNYVESGDTTGTGICTMTLVR